MNRLRILLVVIASAGVIGGAQAAATRVGPDVAAAERAAVSSLNGAVNGLPAVRVSGESSAPARKVAEGRRGGSALRLFLEAVPEPGDWMRLLSGLLVVAVIARRKASGMTG